MSIYVIHKHIAANVAQLAWETTPRIMQTKH